MAREPEAVDQAPMSGVLGAALPAPRLGDPFERLAGRGSRPQRRARLCGSGSRRGPPRSHTDRMPELSRPAPAVAAGAAGRLGFKSTSGRWVVAATVLGSGMASIDATVVGIALPTIGRQFHAGVAQLQWVTNAYTLTLAGLLLLGGSLGDRFGRRRVFLIGTVWFALASMLCGLAPDAQMLIAARALQGVGAALLTPGSLAILQASFVPDDRPKAIGAWSGFGGVATAIGPFVGGWLIGAISWRLIFFINVPVAVAVILVASRYVPESRDRAAAGRIDALGAILVSAGAGRRRVRAHGGRHPRLGLAGHARLGDRRRGLARRVRGRPSPGALPDDAAGHLLLAPVLGVPTRSPSPSTARSAGRCSCCRSSSSRCSASRRSPRAPRCCRSP